MCGGGCDEKVEIFVTLGKSMEDGQGSKARDCGKQKGLEHISSILYVVEWVGIESDKFIHMAGK